MKKIVLFSAALFFQAICVPTHAAEDFNVYKKPVFEEFMKIVKETAAQLKKPYAHDALGKKAERLLEQGVKITGAYAAHEAECKPILDIYAKDAGSRMKNAEPEGFDKDYRKFRLLKDKGIDIEDESIEECLEFTTFTTSPAAIFILSEQYHKKKDKALLGEIREEIMKLHDQIYEELHEMH